MVASFLAEVGATFGKGVFDVDFAKIALELLVNCKKVRNVLCG